MKIELRGRTSRRSAMIFCTPPGRDFTGIGIQPTSDYGLILINLPSKLLPVESPIVIGKGDGEVDALNEMMELAWPLGDEMVTLRSMKIHALAIEGDRIRGRLTCAFVGKKRGSFELLLDDPVKIAEPPPAGEKPTVEMYEDQAKRSRHASTRGDFYSFIAKLGGRKALAALKRFLKKLPPDESLDIIGVSERQALETYIDCLEKKKPIPENLHVDDPDPRGRALRPGWKPPEPK